MINKDNLMLPIDINGKKLLGFVDDTIRTIIIMESVMCYKLHHGGQAHDFG